MRRALIHAVLGPISAHLLVLSLTFTTTVLAAPAEVGRTVKQALALAPQLLTLGQGLVQLLWMVLAWIGVLIADTRRPRTILGVVRLAIGAVFVGAPGVVAWLVYGANPIAGALAWMAVCAGSLTICRWVSQAAGAGLPEISTIDRAAIAPIPEARGVFGRRGVI